MSFLTALAPLLVGIVQPIKDYFTFKAKESRTRYDLEIAKIEAEKQAIISQNEAETQRIQAYLSSVSRGFRQFTFFFLILPVLVSVFFPEYATTMWTNFKIIPEWFQILFVSVYSAIWGLPIIKENVGNMFKSIGNAIELRREYKIKKYNAKAFFDVVRKGLFPKGMTKEQVEMFEKALEGYKNE